MAVPAPSRPARTFVLESIRIEGNTRTPAALVRRRLGLAEGAPVDPDAILDAIDALRAADLFAAVDFRTAPGTERGRVALVVLVVEKRVEFQFGTGYRDLDGWYLIPAELRFDNRLGRGEQLRLTSKLGYRIAGIALSFREPHGGKDGRLFWGLDAGGSGVEQVYFVDGVEYSHHLGRGHLGGYAGIRLGASWTAEAGARGETVDADSVPEARQADEVRDIQRGDPLPFDDLPAPIRASVGERKGQVLHAAIARDTRSPVLVAGTPSRGSWGRLRAEALLRDGARTTSVTADLRAYRRVAEVALAMRLRGGVVGEDAAFYDRFHLGGLYTVRGVPSQSLSPPEGHTRFWTASLEVRGPLAGRPDRPRLAGLLFVDAGQGGGPAGAGIGDGAGADEVSASAGFGLRVRVPWVEWFGLDAGIPLTESPVGESFHVNGALGWNF
jgi:outer membrane protein assembly factor BamA